MKKVKVVSALFSILFFISLTNAKSSKNLFVIERNTNSNIVCYDLNFSKGKINEKNPIDAYWIMNEEGGKREKITSLEQKAYGFEVSKISDDKYQFTLNSVKEKTIFIYIDKKQPRADIVINGQDAYLSKVYVFAKNGFLGIPRVSYYILTGKDKQTGKEISEKIEVNQNKTKGEKK